jgi:DNA-binding response OmpR family regulator
MQEEVYKKKALIIDDEVDLCRLLSLQLSSLGITNEFVNTISEGKEKFRNNQYGIVFLDLNLKDGSGFEMLDYMGEFPKLQKVIVISAYDNERNKVLECGADFFLPKPFTKKKIAQIIDSI